MTARSRLFRAWSAQVWQWVLQALEAMAGLNPTDPFSGWGPPPYPVVPIGWVHCTQCAAEPRAALPEVTRQVMTEERGVFTPAEQARLRVLRDRYQANRTLFTARELAHLHFLRWLHRTGRITG